MKTKKLLLACLTAIPTMALLTSSTLDSTGKLSNSGSPGEYTCSQAGCHGAGNGQGSTGGLPDNGGPGNIVITSNPAFINGNQYVPNTVYHMTVKVSDSGKSQFGFDFEALDNSGNTDPFTDNSVGTITITDATYTRKGQPAHIVNGSPVFGRMNVAHKTPAPGSGSFSFNFDWTAPASGTVNLYAAGNAVNGDGLENAMDNVYTTSMQLVPQGSTPVAQFGVESVTMETFPNPATGRFTVRLASIRENNLVLQLYSLDGKLVKDLVSKKDVPGIFTQTFSTEGLAKGIYMLHAVMGHTVKTQRILVE